MNAFDLIALKQKLGTEYAAEVELWVLIHFDAAKRGQLGPIGYNFISRHLVQAQFIFARFKDTKRLALAVAAGAAWHTAGARPEALSSLTTPEYTAMRAGLRCYFQSLPRVEAGTYRQACNVADQLMK